VLRIAFFANSTTSDSTPAVYCKDYYADEIAQEKTGLSNSTFYTDTYVIDEAISDSQWICPNLTESTITDQPLDNLQLTVYSCQDAKMFFDFDFEPDEPCVA